MKPHWWEEAANDLARRDRVMRKLVRAHPGASLKRRSDAFTALARAITGQQISVKAADAIWRRLVATAAPEAVARAFPRLDPAQVAALTPRALRAAGKCRLSLRRSANGRYAGRAASPASAPRATAPAGSRSSCAP